MSIIKEVLLFAPSSGGGKEYKVVVSSDAEEFYSVDAYFGPAGNLRGHAPQGSGLTREHAEQIFAKTVKKKMGGSGSSVYSLVYENSPDYLYQSSVTPVQLTAQRVVASPYHAQLLGSLDTEEELREKLMTGEYIAQVKADGDRVMCQVKNGVATFFNRKGQVRVDSRTNIAQALLDLNEDFFLDGEIVADQYYLWDVLQIGSDDLRGLHYAKRFSKLLALIRPSGACLKVISTCLPSDGFEAQWKLFQYIKEKGEEGIVLHLATSPHIEGRNNDHLKFKLKERSTCIVSGVNQKRSVSLALFDKWKDLVAVGNVSIPSNFPVPVKGDLVEIEYLYKFQEGSLFQPVYMGKRDDIDQDECTLSQVRRYKLQVLRIT